MGESRGYFTPYKSNEYFIFVERVSDRENDRDDSINVVSIYDVALLLFLSSALFLFSFLPARLAGKCFRVCACVLFRCQGVTILEWGFNAMSSRSSAPFTRYIISR